MRAASQHLPLIPARLRDELARYAIVSAYLYVCFGAIILYKAAILRAHNIDFPVLGLAVAKALILGKFIVAGRALHLGERHDDKPLIYGVLYKVAVFAALLLVLSVFEEIVVTAIHGRPLAEAFSHITGTAWPEMVVSCVLLCLILTPYFGLAAIDDGLEKGRLHRMFFGGD